MKDNQKKNLIENSETNYDNDWSLIYKYYIFLLYITIIYKYYIFLLYITIIYTFIYIQF